MICVCGTKLCKLKMVSDILDHPVLMLSLVIHVQKSSPQKTQSWLIKV